MDHFTASADVRLSGDQYREVNRALREIYEHTKCSAALLIEASGALFARSGTVDSETSLLLATLAAANFSASSEMARVLGEQDGFRVHFHEGVKRSIYMSGVSDRLALVVVFTDATTFGMVRLLATRTAELLAQLLQTAPLQKEAPAAKMDQQLKSDEFQEELSARLTEILQDKGGAAAG